MKNLKFKVVKTTALLFIAPVSHAIADNPPVQNEPSEVGGPMPPLPGMEHREMPERMMKELSLTKEQKQKIKAIREDKREKAEALHNEQKAKMAALQTALKSGTDDEVRKAFSEVQSGHQKLAAMHLEGMLETRALLNPQQREIFSKMSQGMMAGHRKGRHGPGKGEDDWRPHREKEKERD